MGKKMMSVEIFASGVDKALGGGLVSAVLYGSTLEGMLTAGMNVMLVAAKWTPDQMDAIKAVVKPWTSAGNPAPLLFTRERLADCCDVFPIEMLDMRQAYRVVHGVDVLAGLEISRANLRHQVEFELRSKLVRLREGYLACGGDAKCLAGILVASSTPVLVVMRAALRLFEQGDAPADKLAALERLRQHIPLDAEPFIQIAEAKRSGSLPKEEARELFDRYLAQVELATDAVNAL
jgi:hypothetical protein